MCFFCIFVARNVFMTLLKLIYLFLGTMLIVLSVYTILFSACREEFIKSPVFTGIARLYIKPDEKLNSYERNLLVGDMICINPGNGPPAFPLAMLWHRQQ